MCLSTLAFSAGGAGRAYTGGALKNWKFSKSGGRAYTGDILKDLR